jgi:peptidoglycan hydrolase-like protein with peptidoglycan-binding domain
MSTQYQTPRYDTSQYDTPRPRNNTPWTRIWAIIIGVVIAAALAVLATIGLTHTASTPTPTATATSATNPAQPTTPAATPSAAVKQLQQELGQLNYYQGPVDGLMGPQTTAAIKDLQRQAGLPQTGTMNAATQTALQNYLKNGNNQMGGNS